MGSRNLRNQEDVNNAKAVPVLDAAFIVIRRLFLWR